ncbi:Nn.00g087390.m01.CDS01 [Neocucurbitaria sp. VM-36]
MTSPALPDDILHVLCEELANQEQFDTLFNCACSSRVLAVPALTHLYRSHHQAPVRGGGEDLYGLPPATKLLTIQRWSILWRSIIASSLDATLFPYCRYIRSLDFRDLGYLLDDDQFRVKVSKQFFSGPLKQFEKIETRTNIKGKKFTRLKNADIIDAIGEVVTQHTPTLELISGELLSGALVRWTPRLPRLQSLELWDGKPLEDELVHASIYEHCPQFGSLMIYTWRSEDNDHKFSKFLSSMRPNSLKTLQTISDIHAGAETFLALNHHGGSLEDLRLCVSNDSLPHLSLLQGCTALRNLRVEDTHGSVDLETTQNDVFLEMVAWLRKCESLQRLSFSKLQSGAAIITPVLLEHNIKLISLEIDAYSLKDHKTFHQALVHQQSSLKYLSLSGDTDGMFRDDLDILVDSLKQLHELRDLKLILPEILRDEHIIAIIGNLILLEDLYVSGLELNDIVLDSLAGLPSLRNVTLSGISKFTIEGLVDFVNRLGSGNQGIRVTIDMADPDTLLPEDSLNVVRDCLTEKTGGTLEYMALRDPNLSEFEGESD